MNLASGAAKHPDTAASITTAARSATRTSSARRRLAGFSARAAHGAKGDRVLLYLQKPAVRDSTNAVLRADAVVVPVNPMT